MFVIQSYAIAFWQLTVAMAPWLLLGYVMAGVLKQILPDDLIARRLSGEQRRGVWWATLLGIPLPICSCGVIPLAAHLRSRGAGRGPAMAFLVSTPITGVDSVLATWGLLGPVHAVARPLVALLAGLFTGHWVNATRDPVDPALNQPSGQVVATRSNTEIKSRFSVRDMLHYGLDELLGETAGWLWIGLLLGSAVTVILPELALQDWIGNPWLAYPAVILISLPLYVCATGSIPVAAGMMSAGLSPGAALVFLMLGPATNSATLTFVAGSMGRRVLWRYLAALVLVAVPSGLLLDALWESIPAARSFIPYLEHGHPAFWQWGSAVVLLLLMTRQVTRQWFRTRRHNSLQEIVRKHYRVEGMTCQNCVKRVYQAVDKLATNLQIDVDPDSGILRVNDSLDEELVLQAVQDVGYVISVMDAETDS